MLSNYPFEGDYPIIQQFGDSPRSFGSLKCQGVQVRGHPGIDFALPIGRPVLAVAGGTVLAARDEDGLGLVALVQHHWGQTLYAHLSALHVAPGDPADAGQTLGLSGDSGLGAQPHLHFGLRITPYTLADGWCGYTDPVPYLHRLTRGRGPLIGPHIIGGVHRRLDLLRHWQPRQIVVVDPNPDEMRLLRQACPDSVIIGRVYEADHLIMQRIRTDPLAAARWAHEKTLSRVSPDVDYWQFANEILQDGDSLPLLNRFELERMRLAEAEHANRSYRCALFGFSVGNPDLPETARLAHWRLLYPAMRHAEAHGHIVALHQYGMPDLWGPSGLYDWYIHRLEHQILRRLPFKRLQFAVTEFGIDGLIRNDRPSGWRDFADEQGYLRQLGKAAAYLERYSGRMVGCSLFTLGHYPPWGSYDIEGSLAGALAQHADRGVWANIDAEVTGIDPGDFEHSLDPGVEALPDTHTGACEVLPSPPGYEPLVELRTDPRFAAYHMQIKRVDERPDRQEGEIAYVVKDVFMTVDGSWQITGRPDDVPQWAIDSYYAPEFLEAGADHHLFGAVIGLDGKLVRDMRITYWSDGFERLGDPDYDGYTTICVKPESGWANLPLAGSSSFAPDRGESGPWCWAPGGAAEVVCGGGLPHKHHVSTFVVWQAVPRAELDERLSAAAGDGVYPGALTYPLRRRLSRWASYYGLAIRPLPVDTDATIDQSPLLVKDLFTAVIDADCTQESPGALPEWASEDYRIPDDATIGHARAGLCARLYAAVAGADGRLIPAQDMVFSRTGLEGLHAQGGANVIHCPTDPESGWAHLVVSADSRFSPGRGQSGPWNWAPLGAAEAVCGGGIPAGRQLAIFAVWQAAGPRR